MMKQNVFTLLAVTLCTAAACSDGSDVKSDAAAPSNQPEADRADAGGVVERSDSSTGQPATSVDPNLPAFCAREGDDAIRDVFCAGAQPSIRSLADFQNLFDVNPRGPDPNQQIDEFRTALYLSPTNGDVAVLSHSTALPGHVISPINPRAILIGEKIILAYQRGVQRLEIATRARTNYAFVFYLLSFEQACNEREDGCSPGDLYTAKVENDWTHTQIRDDEDLKNSTSDCRQCHRRGTEQSTLLMRELKSPWTHFMFPTGQSSGVPGVSGSNLMEDYQAAKGDELYGGLAVDTISPLGAFNLQTIVGREQPLLFDAPGIENERYPWGPSGYPPTAGPSSIWNAAYEAFKRGEQLALPYLEQRAVDVNKQTELARAYQRYRAGEIDADDLPDLADIFPDDPQVRAQIGLQTEPDATPVDALIQACGGCHNDVLDQSISRARFSIALSRLDRAEIDSAIDRIERPRNAPGAMPPPESRELDDAGRDRLLEYLRQDLKAIELDPRLEHAASVGMLGGGGS